ncbi:MAG: response regulator transcription factor [Acidobacteriota bacterium]
MQSPGAAAGGAGGAGARTRVLIIEDERDLAELLRHTLERSGEYVVEIAATGAAGLRAASAHPPDVILLDLSLPALDGLDVCRLLRQRDATAGVPIIMLTARTDERDRVVGLEAGADDYITKPFSTRELAARVRAVLRRSSDRRPRPLVYRGRHLVADFEAVAVTVDGQPVRLTRREFELLRYFVENRNRVLSRDRLLERVWGYDRFVETRSVDVHVGRLRQKLGPAAMQIETVVGLGYRFVEQPGVSSLPTSPARAGRSRPT